MDPLAADDMPRQEEVTLILPVPHTQEIARRWLRSIAGDPTLSALPIIAVVTDETELPQEEIVRALKPLAVVNISLTRSQEEPDLLAAARQDVFARVPTRYFTVVPGPHTAASGLSDLPTRLAQHLAMLRQAHLPTDLPLYVHAGFRLRPWGQAYIHAVLQHHPRPAGDLSDYLGNLALHAGVHTLESVDTNGVLVLRARSALGRFNLHHRPPWSMQIAVYDRAGTLCASAPTHASQRIDAAGVARWEDLRAEIDVCELPSGEYTLRLQLDPARPEFAAAAPLRPARGLLANARVNAVSDGRAYYLLHTVGRGEETRLTIHHASSARAIREWNRILIREDFRNLFRPGRPRRMALYRVLRLATAPFLRRKEVWLIGEREDTAQDNGLHLFRYLRVHHPQRSVYYIIDRDSPHRNRVSPLGNVVAHSSWRHRLLMLHAQVIANAYAIRHMTPRQWDPSGYTRHLAWRVGALRVYLKHGVHLSTNAVKRGTGGYDLYLAVDPRETAAIRSGSGYEDQVVETGLPRYDALSPTPPSRRVLFMPTWRRYLVPKLFGNETEAAVEFTGSTYERFLTSFLSSPRLREILERYDYTLEFLPHYNVQEFFAHLPDPHPRISLADPAGRSFTDLLTGCDVFLTDYSSVQFDVAYVGTPIIYTHFDAQEYRQGHASDSWFDYHRDGFGPVTTTLAEALDELEEVLARGAVLDPRYEARVEAAFTHRDARNNERVVAAIDKLITERQRTFQGIR